jgi:hypothetical protein
MQKHNINPKKEIYKDAPAGIKEKHEYRQATKEIEMPQWK